MDAAPIPNAAPALSPKKLFALLNKLNLLPPPPEKKLDTAPAPGKLPKAKPFPPKAAPPPKP